MIVRNYKIIFLTNLIIFLFYSIACCATESFTFANIPWESSPNNVKEILSKRYNFIKQDNDGDLFFNGSIKSVPVTIVAIIANKKLVRIIISIEPENNLYRYTYRNFRDLLIEKYGQPIEDNEFYSSPYENGDGYEEQAIRNNKGFISTKWPKASDGSTIGMQSRNNLTIALFYDTKAGEEEEKRRASKTTSDL